MTESIGCGDNSCIFGAIRKSGGMGTNGGCRCFDPLESWIESEKRWNREEVGKLRRDVLRLAQALRQEREDRAREKAAHERDWEQKAKAIAHNEQLRAEVMRLRAALASAHGLIAANRLVLGEYAGVREVGEVERQIRAALGEAS